MSGFSGRCFRRLGRHTAGALLAALWLAGPIELPLARAGEPTADVPKADANTAAAIDEDDGFAIVSDANMPGSIEQPQASPLHPTGIRPITCCHPNIPHPAQTKHPTLAALAAAVQPRRTSGMPAAQPAPIQPPGPVGSRVDDTKLGSAGHSESAAVPAREAPQAPFASRTGPIEPNGATDNGPFAPRYDFNNADVPAREANFAAASSTERSVAPAFIAPPSGSERYSNSAPPTRSTLAEPPLTAPFRAAQPGDALREPPQAPADFKTQVIENPTRAPMARGEARFAAPRPREYHPAAPGEPPQLLPGTKAKIIENPWVKPSGQPAAQVSPPATLPPATLPPAPQRPTSPVRLVRYHEPEERLLAAPASPPLAASEVIPSDIEFSASELEANPLREWASRPSAAPPARWSNGNPLR